MKAIVLAAALVALAGGASADDERPLYPMMGGDCPMMGMMVDGGYGSGHMGWGGGMGGGMGRGMMAGQHRGWMGRGGDIDAMIEGRLAYLNSALKPTEAQTEVWTAYADAVRDRVETMRGKRETVWESMSSGTTIERIDARIAGMEGMLEAMKLVRPATAALYAALDSDQKEIADQLIGGGCGGM